MLIVAAVSCQVKSQPTMLPPSSVRWDGITRCRARRFFFYFATASSRVEGGDHRQSGAKVTSSTAEAPFFCAKKCLVPWFWTHWQETGARSDGERDEDDWMVGEPAREWWLFLPSFFFRSLRPGRIVTWDSSKGRLVQPLECWDCWGAGKPPCGLSLDGLQGMHLHSNFLCSTA